LTISSVRALERLREGNQRFVAGTPRIDPRLDEAERHRLAARQEPFAVVLGCSDARVPVELVFDQGFGDLFVIRVAGNVVASSQIDSVEFAVERLGVELVVVLGHTHCGAIRGTIEKLKAAGRDTGTPMPSIVSRVRPAIETLVEEMGHADENTLVRAAVRANVRASVSMLRHGSRLLESLQSDGRVNIVGAEYSLDDGVVDFFAMFD